MGINVNASGNAVVHLSLSGQRQVVAGLNETSAGMNRLTRATQAQSAASKVANERSWLMNQALFTTRRFAYAGTLAFTGLAAATIKMGIGFNVNMENNRVALQHFLKSSSAVNAELDYMFELAAKTPFEFSGLASATRRFLAMGFSLKETNNYMSVIGDTVAGMAGSGVDLLGLVTVFGQIRASGRLLGQDLLQLEQHGINAPDILKKAGLLNPRASAGNIGQLQIPSSIAIPALMKGMNAQFGGSAEEQSKTLAGQWSTLHDYMSRFAGTITLPLFTKLRDQVIPGMNALFTEIDKYTRSHGGKISISRVLGMTDKQFGLGGNLISAWKTLVTYAKAFWSIMKNGVIPSVMIVATLLKTVLAPIVWLSGIGFTVLGHHMNLLVPIITYLIILWTFEKALHIANKISTMQEVAAKISLWAANKSIIAIEKTMLMYQGLRAAGSAGTIRSVILATLKNKVYAKSIGAVIGHLKEWHRWSFAIGRINGRFITGKWANQRPIADLSRGILTRIMPVFDALSLKSLKGAMAKMMASAHATDVIGFRGQAMTVWTNNSLVARAVRNVTFFSRAIVAMTWAERAAAIAGLILNPIFLAVAAIASIAVLYWQWRAFRMFVNNIFSWIWHTIKNSWPWIVGAMFGLVGIGIVALVKNFGAIKSFFVSIYNWAVRIGTKLAGYWHTFARPFIWLGKQLGLIGSPTISQSNSVVPGSTPYHSTVPMTNFNVLGAKTPGLPSAPLTAELHLDGKKVAQAVFKAKQDAGARR